MPRYCLSAIALLIIALSTGGRAEAGAAGKPIWFNEVGWDSPSDSVPTENMFWGRVSEEQQADYTERAIKLAREQWPWAGVFSIWYFRQVGHIPANRADYYFAMVNVGFTPRPIYYKIKELGQNEQVAKPGFYEETNGAVQTGGASRGQWQMLLDSRASGGAALVGNVPGSNLTIHFNGSGLDLLVTREPHRGRMQVTIDDRPANALPADGELDLAAPVEAWQQRLTLARGLPLGKHTARLTVLPHAGASNDTRNVVDGFIVTDNASALPPGWVYTTLPALTLLALGGIIALRRRRRSTRY